MLACLARVALVENVHNRKVSDYSNLKIISPKQMLQRLPIAHVQVKVGNTSENLLNDIRQIIYSLYQATEITEKLYDNIMNAIKLQNRMGTIFMSSRNSKTSDLHRLLLNLSDEIKLIVKGCCFI